MKKILSLLLLSAPLCAMELQIIQLDQKAAAIKHVSKSIYSESKDMHIKPANMHLESKNMHIEQKSVFAPKRLGSIELSHSKKGFKVYKDDEKHVIKRYYTDPIVRNMTKEELKTFLTMGYLSVNQMDNGEFTLKANGRLNGGGPIGAAIGAFLGKAAISIAGHGTIQIIGILSGPAYLPVVIGLESCFGGAIEATSMAGAVAGGMIGAVATGPV